MLNRRSRSSSSTLISAHSDRLSSTTTMRSKPIVTVTTKPHLSPSLLVRTTLPSLHQHLAISFHPGSVSIVDNSRISFLFFLLLFCQKTRQKGLLKKATKKKFEKKAKSKKKIQIMGSYDCCRIIKRFLLCVMEITDFVGNQAMASDCQEKIHNERKYHYGEADSCAVFNIWGGNVDGRTRSVGQWDTTNRWMRNKSPPWVSFREQFFFSFHVHTPFQSQSPAASGGLEPPTIVFISNAAGIFPPLPVQKLKPKSEPEIFDDNSTCFFLILWFLRLCKKNLPKIAILSYALPENSATYKRYCNKR